MTFRYCDESDYGFGWIAEERVARTSHALAVEGRVWLFDAVLWPDALERARSLGEPAAVIQLLDRHNRDCAAVAAQLGVPHLRVPDRVDAPVELVSVLNMPLWHERALWWPERRVLVAADVLGTVGYFTHAARPSVCIRSSVSFRRSASSGASIPTSCSSATARACATRRRRFAKRFASAEQNPRREA